MCGIFGYLANNRLTIKENILKHRGPDDWGVVYKSIDNITATLFQSRLSIIGLGVQGHQPYEKYQDKVLVFNGEIYNYKEIRKQLNDDYGVSFETETDTEVLYELIVKKGIDEALNILKGIFAFSYFDKASKEIYLVRDHLGVKPIYYSSFNKSFIFSSECKTFFELGLVQPELNKKLLGEYFANGWIYEPDTLFKNIYKLESGHYLKYSISKDSIETFKYWDINDGATQVPDIKSIVEEQTISDVPIGSYYSGGIDSSIVTYLLKDKDVINLNLSMDDDESKRVKIMEKAYGLKVESIKYQSENLKLYGDLIYFMDEPIADPAIIPAYQLAKRSRELGRIVMLSGMGGDEIDAGYSRHRILANLSLFSIIRFIPERIIKFIFSKKIQRDLLRLRNFVCSKEPENYFSLTAYLSKSEIDNLVGYSWHNNYSKKIQTICSEYKGNKRYFWLDLKGFLSSHNLIYMDKASMAASVEVRVPLLDHTLVKSFFTNVDSKKIVGKKRLSGILKNYIGDNYQKSKKEGFRYEINKWIQNDIDWDEIINYYNKLDILNTSQVKNWIINSKNDPELYSMKLWYVYTLYCWLNKFKVRVN